MGITTRLCTAVLCLVLSSSLIANSDSEVPRSYLHCFELQAKTSEQLSQEQSLHIGDCFLRTAENIILNSQSGDIRYLPNQAYVLSALEYADSWYALASSQGDTQGTNQLEKTRKLLSGFGKN